MIRETDLVDECYADKDLSLLKKLTLVIPTYNRNYYLSRCLWYHAHFPFGEIIVADSSPEAKKVVNRETVRKIQELFGANILYLEYEPETEKYGGDIYRKWGDAVQHVETDYSQIVTDKEFAIPVTQTILIDYLDRHCDYNTAGALEIHETLSSDMRQYIRKIETCKDYNQNNPFVRLSACFEDYSGWHILTAIRRSQFHKSLYGELERYDLNDIRFGDILPRLLSILYSKVHYEPDKELLLRDLSKLYCGKKLIRDESSGGRYPRLDEYIREGIFDEKILSLQKLLGDSTVSQYIGGGKISLESLTAEISYQVTLRMVGSRIPIINYENILNSKRPFHKQYSYIMYHLYLCTPECIRKICRGLLGVSELHPREQKSSDINASPEITIIRKIISETLISHEKDDVLDLF